MASDAPVEYKLTVLGVQNNFFFGGFLVPNCILAKFRGVVSVNLH